MLSLTDNKLVAAILIGPKAQRQTGAEVGLKVGEMRALLAISALSDCDYVEVRELVASKLAARTRLRAQVRVLVLAGCVTRKRRRGRHCLLLTDKGKRVVRDCMLATHRAIGKLLNP